MWSDLALGPSCKVKQWFTDSSKLSFLWIEFASGLDMLGLVTHLCILIVAYMKVLLKFSSSVPS